MAAKLSDILAELQAYVVARVAPTTATFATGARELRARVLPPAIVWVPTDDDYAPASRSVPASIDAQTLARSVRTRVAGFEAHVWGESLEQAETLVNAVVAGLHMTAYGAYGVTRGTWERPDYLEQGEACTVALTVSIPIVDVVPTTVVIDAAANDPTGSVAGDELLDSGET